MKKLIELGKLNILGIAVAIGVISFICEALIFPGNGLTFTKCSGFLILIIAVRSRNKGNIARKKILFEKSPHQSHNH